MDFDVEEQEVKKLQQQMHKAEEGQTLDPSLSSELSRILFARKTVMIDGMRGQFVASCEATIGLFARCSSEEMLSRAPIV